MDVPASLLDFSLVRGGTLARLLPRRWLNLKPELSAASSALALVLLTWAPLPVFALLAGGTELRELVRDLPVHAQLLLTLPLMVLAGPYIDRRLAMALRLFISSELVRGEAVPRMLRSVEQLSGLRRSYVAEVLLLLTAYALSLFPSLALWNAWAMQTDTHLSAAGSWYRWVSVPLLRFFLLRWAWRALVWNLMLLRLSRLPLVLVPTHPDRAGGLGFLATCQASFGSIIFAIGCTVAAAMRERRELAGLADLVRYASPLLVLAVVAVVAIFAPLALFCPVLLRAKRRGDEHFSALAALHSQRFEARWFGQEAWARRCAQEDDVLGAPEISSLQDLGTSFEAERQMRFVPIGRRPVVAVALSAVVPIVPVLMSHRQFLTVVLQLGKLFF
jgi:hypothetical protein